MHMNIEIGMQYYGLLRIAIDFFAFVRVAKYSKELLCCERCTPRFALRCGYVLGLLQPESIAVLVHIERS